jgi:hypothetical protein
MIAGSLVGHATMFATPIWPPDETGKHSQAPPFLFTAKNPDATLDSQVLRVVC